MTEKNDHTAPPPDEPAKRQGAGRRWGCGCLLLLGLGYCTAITLPDFVSYREREVKQRARSLLGLCEHEPAAAVIGAGMKHHDDVPYLTQPVYGCATLADYRQVTRTLYNDTIYNLADHRRSRNAHIQNDQCRALPEGAEVVIKELRPAQFAAKVRLKGEERAWWTPCSGLRAKEEKTALPRGDNTQF